MLNLTDGEWCNLAAYMAGEAERSINCNVEQDEILLFMLKARTEQEITEPRIEAAWKKLYTRINS
jgi:hypothetical protein